MTSDEILLETPGTYVSAVVCTLKAYHTLSEVRLSRTFASVFNHNIRIYDIYMLLVHLHTDMYMHKRIYRLRNTSDIFASVLTYKQYRHRVLSNNQTPMPI